MYIQYLRENPQKTTFPAKNNKWEAKKAQKIR